MTDYSPSRTFEKKTLIGLWWIPDQEHKCYGTLSFDINGEQSLRIIGSFEERFLEDLPEYKVIHGICKDEKENVQVTIFNASAIHISQPLLNERNALSQTVIIFQSICIGNTLYSSQDDVRFASFSFGLKNLEIWQDERCAFSTNFDVGEKKVSAEMNVPAPIPIFSDEYVSVSVNYWYQIPVSSLGQTESTMRYSPLIFIKSNAGTLQYYGNKNSFSYYISWIFQLFELLMTGHTFPFCLHGYGPVPQEEPWKQVQMEILYSRDITMKQRKAI